MNGIAHKVSDWLGSLPYFLLFTIICFVWIKWGSQLAFTLFLSILAIYAMIFIQRSTNEINKHVIALLERVETYIKEAKNDVKQDLKKSDKVISLIKKEK
jgi:low affinity Fe/Cu permease